MNLCNLEDQSVYLEVITVNLEVDSVNLGPQSVYLDSIPSLSKQSHDWLDGEVNLCNLEA